MTLKSAFPRIKEVRTFIIDGVGSGGDYHNVSIVFFALSKDCILRSWLSRLKKRESGIELRGLNIPPHHNLGQRWSLVGRQ